MVRYNSDAEEDQNRSDDGLSDLDDDFDDSAWREQRMKELQAVADKQALLSSGDFGKYTEVKEERELMDKVAKSKKAVVHFYHADFRRCGIMDAHLEKLAPIHYETLFYKINVAYIPFLVTKLDIKVLPCVMTFINGAMKDKVTGFEGLNKAGVDSDKFTTEDLEFRLCLSGAIPKSQVKDQAAVQEAMNLGTSKQ